MLLLELPLAPWLVYAGVGEAPRGAALGGGALLLAVLVGRVMYELGLGLGRGAATRSARASPTKMVLQTSPPRGGPAAGPAAWCAAPPGSPASRMLGAQLQCDSAAMPGAVRRVHAFTDALCAANASASRGPSPVLRGGADGECGSDRWSTPSWSTHGGSTPGSLPHSPESLHAGSAWYEPRTKELSEVVEET